ncbi:MAG TPA: tetratricopeptide repeat protein, partial [Myxococcota bacterium]|nr:tetratricopeptide repeat protein [Myxococcota bacterium]
MTAFARGGNAMRVMRTWTAAAGLVWMWTTLSAFSLTDGAEEKAEFVDGLRRDIVKVDHSIEVTKDLIKKSKGAKFLPDIVFRLAELFVEKSRLVYYLEVETRGQEAASSAEAKLLKNEAINIYKDVMREFPDYKDNDKVLFFLGHEFNELGMHDEMIKTYEKLVEDYPKSSLLLEALYILGDFNFNNDNLDGAEKYYNRILEFREAPIHDMARYKLGWVAINRARVDKKFWKKALELFESVVTSENTREESMALDSARPVHIKAEALAGIVFCYTEVHGPKMAL